MRIIFLLGLFLSLIQLQAQERFSYSIPDLQMETTSVWQTIRDIKFFEGHGYQVNLPKGELIQDMIKKSKAGEFGNDDYPILYQFMEDSVYRESDYHKGIANLKARISFLEALVGELSQANWNWGFMTFETYQIHLTLYGSGGSYNPENASILLFTNTEGGFKNYADPAYVLIHEIVHLGIEASLIQKYEVPHAMKERVVDTIVFHFFGEKLPDYRRQEMGDNRLDAYTKSKEDLGAIDQSLVKILQEE
ncbi:MAG: hypothetical protein R8P61_04850 [Bacteroidia bacterium]|nr:hypothetical protein [Bacteroidia bacterium]